jgi:hypothetical protein
MAAIEVRRIHTGNVLHSISVTAGADTATTAAAVDGEKRCGLVVVMVVVPDQDDLLVTGNERNVIDLWNINTGARRVITNCMQSTGVHVRQLFTIKGRIANMCVSPTQLLCMCTRALHQDKVIALDFGRDL